MKKVIVTTSWDDGAVQDLRLLKLLNKYNLKGTFYIPQTIAFEPKKGKPLKRVSEKDILEIAKIQEIGAHGITHTYLDKLNKEQIYNEVKGSKDWLEKLLNKKIKMFAYPGGIFNNEIVNSVKKIGFLGARTTESFKINIENQFLIGISLQCYPYLLSNKEWTLLFQLKTLWKRFKFNLKGVSDLKLPIDSLFNWTTLAKNIFKSVLKNGGVFHLYGHSWEIEYYKLWEDLEKIFKYISNRRDVYYLTNSEVLENL